MGRVQRKHDFHEYGGGGYAVGGASKCYVVKADKLSWNEFAYGIMAHLREQTRGKGARVLIGGWVDNDGFAHLELSDIVQNRREAITMGWMRDQKAIYDLWNNEEIEIPQTYEHLGQIPYERHALRGDARQGETAHLDVLHLLRT